MKKFISKQKNCFLAMMSLILICEILLRINNKFIQTLGVMIFPFIILFGYLLIRHDQKKFTK